jgi:hypothetical protein
MPQAGSEPTIPSIERQQTHALDRAAIGSGSLPLRHIKILPENYNKFRNGKKLFPNVFADNVLGQN